MPLIIRSNNVYLIPTEFKNVRTGEIEKGIRVFDDYASSYYVLFEGELPEDDLDLLRLALECDERAVREILDSIQEESKGIVIGSTYYSWEEIKEVFEDSPCAEDSLPSNKKGPGDNR